MIPYNEHSLHNPNNKLQLKALQAPIQVALSWIINHHHSETTFNLLLTSTRSFTYYCYNYENAKLKHLNPLKSSLTCELHLHGMFCSRATQEKKPGTMHHFKVVPRLDWGAVHSSHMMVDGAVCLSSRGCCHFLYRQTVANVTCWGNPDVRDVTCAYSCLVCWPFLTSSSDFWIIR